ncbi:hypothetical protein GXP67_11695 [Rhodocytophaga rosea]|uniref:Aerotolerance regulator N-terminal domain-containing protein n=1 Tax=Rhodocytophaga rosea TaxID=2704465 RepID=A0A6C0GHG4_9BACT|nr:BatA domain-containing protein [Rhodocytophaga rosea]QHT67254.1 hypothetical protein GXP67_11695 [Rhodocytophaga rosea]
MLQFLNPAYLVALVGLAIPIAIHLWSRKAGKRIRIGSISLLQHAPSKQMRSIRLHELALLLLRCLLLSLLVLLIAQPQWISSQPKKQAGWILISPQIITQLNINTSLQQTIDTLRQNGYEIRLFESGFTKIETSTISEKKILQSNTSYWSLLKEAENQLPSGTHVYAITEENLQAFQGKRPSTDLNLQWITVPTPDTSNIWLSDAFVDKTDSLRIQIGVSQPEGNAFQTLTRKKPPAPITVSEMGLPAMKITPTNGRFTIALSGTDQVIQADTSTQTISILYEQETSEDASYVSSAIQAITEFTRRKINLVQVKQASQIPANTNWLFWLSSQPIPTQWQANVKNGMHLLQYASSEKFISTQTWLQLREYSTIPIYLNRISEADPEGDSIWESGTGKPVLTQEQQEKGSILRLYTRFHPQWNGLVWDASFAETLLQLLHKNSWEPQFRSSDKYDLRMISLQQLLPLQTQAPTKLEETRQLTNLHIPLWILIVLVLVVERWISERKRTLAENQKKNPAQQVVS